MSALTKIAVILLVITSLLLSAGVVVFVNKVEDFNATATAAKDTASKEKDINRDLTSSLNAVNAQIADQAKTYAGRIDALNKDIANGQTESLGLKGQLTKLDQDKKGVEVALGNMTAMSGGLQKQLEGLQAQVLELRGARDKLVEERHSLNVQLTDALSKVDQLSRAVKIAEERAAGARASLTALETKVANMGLTPETMRDRTAAGNQYLEGVVSNVFVAGGKPWASISIGAKENVAKGMKFNVHNANEFLGYLTVQSAEPNEAVGVLEGPKVDQVKNGDQVKTQLQ